MVEDCVRLGDNSGVGDDSGTRDDVSGVGVAVSRGAEESEVSSAEEEVSLDTAGEGDVGGPATVEVSTADGAITGGGLEVSTTSPGTMDVG